MSRQLMGRSSPDSFSRSDAKPGPPAALMLAAVCLSMVAAAVVESQDQPAKQEPKVGRVKMLDTLTGHKYRPELLAFTNGGTTLVSCSANLQDFGNEIKFWDVAARKNTATVNSPEVLVGWTISADEKTLAAALTFNKSGVLKGKIRFYDLSKDNKPQDFNSGSSSTYANPVALSPDGKLLAWGEAGKKIRLWDRPAGKLIGTFTPNADFRVMAFSPGGKRLVSGGGALATVWDVATGGDIKTFQAGKDRSVSSLAFSLDGKTLAVAAHDAGYKASEVKLWEMSTGKNTKTLKCGDINVHAMAFNKDGILACGAGVGKVKLWNANTGNELITLGLHDGFVMCVAFSPDGRTLATGAEGDKAIRLWELPAEPHMYQRLELHKAISGEPGAKN